jgi:hypothetical protein
MDADAITPEEVRRRFRWAKRQGDPAWLWPEVPRAAWREALLTIEGATREALTSGAATRTVNGDPAALGLAAYTCGLGPLLGRWLEQGRLKSGPAIAPVLERHLQHSRRRAGRLQAAGLRVVRELLDRGVPVTVLKGAHTGLDYFPEPGVRPASDIDLLIDPADAETAEEVLTGLGLVPYSRTERECSWRPADGPAQPRSLTHVHQDDPWSVDLHTSLDLVVSAGAPLAELDRLHPMCSARRWGPEPRAAVLDQPLLLLHLAVHAGSGLQNLTLLRLVELGLVIRQDLASEALDWRGFLEAGGRAGLLGYAYPALNLADQLWPGATPGWVLERCAAEAPAGVRRVVGRLAPATAQRIERGSLQEHFMWTSGWAERMRQLAADLVPAAGSWRELMWIYERRAWSLIRGRLTL